MHGNSGRHYIWVLERQCGFYVCTLEGFEYDEHGLFSYWKKLPNLSHYYIQGYLGVGDKFPGEEIRGSFPNIYPGLFI